jgi:hypothetical protein
MITAGDLKSIMAVMPGAKNGVNRDWSDGVLECWSIG